MMELARLSGSILLLFGLSLGMAYLLTLGARMLRGVPSPIPNGQLRIRSGASFYRARFLGETREGWTFTAPLQRDAYVPLRIGEDLVIEAPSERGMLRFRTTLVARKHDSAVMVAERPAKVHVEERRSERRRTDLGDQARVNGVEAGLLDVSGQGAKMCLASPVERGDRVKVELPWEAEPCLAWILDAERECGAVIARLRFEEPRQLPTLK